jgi:small subunit ribosomal protein S1
MKQLIPNDIDEYIAEHKVGDTVSGRVVEQSSALTVVELGDGIRAICSIAPAPTPDAPAAVPSTEETGASKPKSRSKTKAKAKAESRPDLSSISSMLKARWQGNAPAAISKSEPLSEGQIRSFKIVKLDAEAKMIEVELA